MLRAALCFASGLLVAVGGWRLQKSLEQPPGTTTFYRIWAPRVWLSLLANVLLLLGLMLCFIYAPMFWIARPR